MKRAHWISLATYFVMLSGYAQQQPSLWSSEYFPSERAADYTRWTKVAYETNGFGIVSALTNGFIQVGPGLNRWTGITWTNAAPELILTNNGILGRGAQHTAFFGSDLAGRIPVRVWMPSGQMVGFRIIGLAYHDPDTGTNVLIAEPKSSAPSIANSNWVVYSDAFDDIKCDVRYSYTFDGVRQHVVLRQRPDPPESYGLSNATAHLLVISELVDGPSPQVTERSWPAGRDLERDEILDFGGSMRMVPGRAFDLQDPGAARGVSVTKQYEVIGDRRLIVERVRYPRVREQLLRLPAGVLVTNSPGGVVTNASLPNRSRWFAQGELPPSGLKRASLGATARHPAKIAAAGSSINVATTGAAQKEEPGFVLDWELVHGNCSFSFDCFCTYLISGEVHLTSAQFDLDAVLRFDQGSSLYVDGPVVCSDTSPCGSYPTVLTSVDDNTYGSATIEWSTGMPWPGEYGPALVVRGEDLESARSHLVVLYAAPGIITLDPIYPQLSIIASDALAIKNTADTGSFTISRVGGDWSQSLSVPFSVTGSAVSGVDYNSIGTAATIPANEGTVVVPVLAAAQAGAQYESTVVVA